jgi:hypothetical protein
MPAPASDTLLSLLRREALHPSPENVDLALIDAAVEHGVAPLVYRALHASDGWGALDRDVRARLMQIAREAVIVDEVRAHDLARLVAALHAERVHPILFKGAALAVSHYPDPWLRPRGDSDLLVRQPEVLRAAAVLERLGFRRVPRPRGALVTQQMRYEGAAGGAPIAYDVHWRIADPHAFGDVFPNAELEREAMRDHPSGARRVGNVHALAVACVHRMAHHYDTAHLLLLYDIHLLAGALSDDEWQKFVALAREKRIRSVCRRGLQRAADGLGTPLPLDVQQGLAGGEDEPTAIFTRPRLRRFDILRSDLAALPRWQDRLQLLFNHIFPGREYTASSGGSRMGPVGRIVGGARKWLGPL